MPLWPSGFPFLCLRPRLCIQKQLVWDWRNIEDVACLAPALRMCALSRCQQQTLVISRKNFGHWLKEGWVLALLCFEVVVWRDFFSLKCVDIKDDHNANSGGTASNIFFGMGEYKRFLICLAAIILFSWTNYASCFHGLLVCCWVQEIFSFSRPNNTAANHVRPVQQAGGGWPSGNSGAGGPWPLFRWWWVQGGGQRSGFHAARESNPKNIFSILSKDPFN